MAMLMTVWWVGFVTAVGLCVGSFLNVVIYRLPNELSVFEPKWSFCPRCHSAIRWYDNLPLVGYLRLGGRCRSCGAEISARYPAVEALTALVALVLFDALFLGGSGRAGLNRMADINWRVLDDWPIFLAHFILFSCLLAMSVIDLEHYWVDVRFTTLASLAGIVLHGLWTPGTGSSHPDGWDRPGVLTVLVCGAFLTGLLISWGWGIIIGGGREVEAEDVGFDRHEGETVFGGDGLAVTEGVVVADEWTSGTHLSDGEGMTPLAGDESCGEEAVVAKAPRGVEAACVMGLALVGYIIWMLSLDSGDVFGLQYGMRAAAIIAVFFIFVTVGGMAHRESDVEIVEAIEHERPSARLTAIKEIGYLLPGILLAGVVLWLCLQRMEWLGKAQEVIRWAVWGQWRPLVGVGTAVSGLVIAAGLGWLVRIGFTLLLGKEAFGTGDIHLMAAAGAVAGWQVVLVGFFLSAVLALSGWLIALPVKRSRAIPFGPWLSLAFFTVCVLYGPIMNSQVVERATFVWKSLAGGGF